MKVRILLVAFFIIGSITVSAQTQATFSKAKITTKPSAAIHSDYAEMEQKILKIVKGNTIPISVPKYVKGQTIEEYKIVLKKWAENNLPLLTEEYQRKIKTRKNK
jgi:hypothetical protein